LKGLTLPEEGPSPSNAVQRSSSTDAVKELSLQEDGKMMENDTDTVDMDTCSIGGERKRTKTKRKRRRRRRRWRGENGRRN
jgi:hypothetical protein